MSDERLELNDGLLGAYADGELDAESAERVERALRDDVEAARRLKAIEALTALVREATAGDVGPVSSSTVNRRGLGRRASSRRRGWLSWRVAAAFVAGALVLIGVTRFGSDSRVPVTGWHEHALAFHDMVLRARDNQPRDAMLDILTHQPDELARLISFSPSMPDLAAHGYVPSGAHLIAAPDGPIVYVLFEGTDRPPVGFAMTRRGEGVSPNDFDRPSVHAMPGGVTLVSWSSGPFDYGLSTEGTADSLMPLVDTARRSLPTRE